jgi:hypothetical protein
MKTKDDLIRVYVAEAVVKAYAICPHSVEYIKEKASSAVYDASNNWFEQECLQRALKSLEHLTRESLNRVASAANATIVRDIERHKPMLEGLQIREI